jgi:hypothetical protein
LSWFWDWGGDLELEWILGFFEIYIFDFKKDIVKLIDIYK